RILKQSCDKQAICRKQIDVTLITVKCPKLNPTFAAQLEGWTEQPGCADQLSRERRNRRMVRCVKPRPQTWVGPFCRAVFGASDRFRSKRRWSCGEHRPSVGSG